MDFGLWFLTGILTSFHCVAMCGTMVASYAIGGDSGGKRINVLPHLIYNMAKLTAYTTVGAALGFLGSAIDFGPLRGGVSIFAGLFMVIMGLNMLNIFPWLRFVQIRMPKSVGKYIFKHKPGKGSNTANEGYAAPLFFGLLTGFMPCGPLQAMQLFAAGSGSALRGAASMFTFGLGTIPLMLGFGTFTSAISGTFKKKIMKFSAGVVIVLGFVMLNRGLVLQGIPYNLNMAWNAVKTEIGISEGPAGESKVAKGVQEATIVIENVRYVPGTINLKKDVPVRLTIDRRENNICSDQLVIPQIGVRQVLQPFGKTVVEFTPTQEGPLNLTCQMGMMQGTAIVGAGAGAGARVTAGPKPLFTFLSGAILAWIAIRMGWMPGFAKPASAHGAAMANARPTGASASRNRRKRKAGVFELEISHVAIAGGAVVLFAIFSGVYLGSAPGVAGAGGSAGTAFGTQALSILLAGAALSWIAMKLKGVPGFINLPKRPRQVEKSAESAGNVIRLEISHQTVMIAAIIIFALFGLYLQSSKPAVAYRSNYGASAPAQAPAVNPAGQYRYNNGSTQVNEGRTAPADKQAAAPTPVNKGG